MTLSAALGTAAADRANDVAPLAHALVVVLGYVVAAVAGAVVALAAAAAAGPVVALLAVATAGLALATAVLGPMAAGVSAPPLPAPPAPPARHRRPSGARS